MGKYQIHKCYSRYRTFFLSFGSVSDGLERGKVGVMENGNMDVKEDWKLVPYNPSGISVSGLYNESVLRIVMFEKSQLFCRI